MATRPETAKSTDFIKIGDQKFNRAFVKIIHCVNRDALWKGAYCDVIVAGAKQPDTAGSVSGVRWVNDPRSFGTAEQMTNYNPTDYKYTYHASTKEYDACLKFLDSDI